MKKILFITNLPSPYRMDFFNYLGQSCDLTVIFERKKAEDRDDRWVGHAAIHFKEVYADLKPFRKEGSKGRGLIKLLKISDYDLVIFSGYASPSVRAAIAYCIRKKIPYYIEYDGGFDKKDSFIKACYKKYLLTSARGHFITCRELESYLTRMGIPQERLLRYPFSSLNRADISLTVPTLEYKAQLKKELGIHTACAILTVGQFIPRKGFDILLQAAAKVSEPCDIYIVGGEPTEEYLRMKEDLGLTNVHFIGFMSKEELKKWYRACDIFVLPTREDIWGLVINEAMANGLPVISTNRCIAALELIEEGKNGYVVPVEDADALAEKLSIVISDTNLRERMAAQSLEKIREYTIENMVQSHVNYLHLRGDSYPTEAG